jgi:hypothetical protein
VASLFYLLPCIVESIRGFLQATYVLTMAGPISGDNLTLVRPTQPTTPPPSSASKCYVVFGLSSGMKNKKRKSTIATQEKYIGSLNTETLICTKSEIKH